MPSAEPPLRIAYLTYRGNPHCGGQGVYTRLLTRQLAALGHEVTVFSGPPYPIVDDGVELVQVPSLDLYREPDPFRIPKLREFTSREDVLEFALMGTAGFPEPRTFSLRVRKLLAARRSDFDIVHDNQGMGSGMLGVVADGWPLLTTLHHPITVDRRLDLASSRNPWRKLTKWRWYGFVRMQVRVGRQLPHFITVSQSSREDITTEMGIDPARVRLVPVGVDEHHFRPRPEVAKVPARIMTTASADAPIKGLVHLLEALAKIRTERPAQLVVIGKAKAGSPVLATLRRLGIEDAVQFVSGVSDDEIVRLYAEAEVACVPSLYEGFSLPAIEAMACGVPVVATTGGALPEVVGTDGRTALLVPPADPGALATAIGSLLDDPSRRAAVAAAGRARVLERFTWQATATATAEEYRRILAEHETGKAAG